MKNVEFLMQKITEKQEWHESLVFCFTSDVDWASEEVMIEYFRIINQFEIKPTLYCTYHSVVINSEFRKNNIERGIHPNFLENSSHGNSFKGNL